MNRTTILLCALLPLFAWAQSNSTIRAFKAEKLYVRALQQYQQGDIRGAIQTFDEVIALDRNHPQAYNAKGDALFELGDFDEAIRSYDIAAQQYPDNASIRNSMGVAAAQMGTFRAAQSYFLEALQIDPNFAAARRNLELAELKMREGNTASNASLSWDDTPVTDYTYGSNLGGNTNGNSNAYPGSSNPSNDPWGDGGTGSNSSWDNNSNWNNDPYSNSNDNGWNDGFIDNGNPRNDNWGTGTNLATGGNTTAPRQPWERPNRNLNQNTYSADRDQLAIGYHSDPYVEIEQVRVTETGTLVSFVVSSLGDDKFPIELAGPGSPEAMYLTDRGFQRVYRLKDIKNFDGWPNEAYELQPGENKWFIAEFERIPNDLYYFHVLEGEQGEPGAWDFYDVELIPTP